MKELYEKIYIKSESDLPKEEGNYLAFRRNPNEITNIHIFPDNKLSYERWLKEVDWYLLPVAQPTDETLKHKLLAASFRFEDSDGITHSPWIDLNDAINILCQSRLQRTDEAIEAWAEETYLSINSQERAIEGAKALRDGNIK